MVGDSRKAGVAGRGDSDDRSDAYSERTGYEFANWVACPACDEQEKASSFAYKTDIVFECYECGLISEFVFGEDISLQNLVPEAMGEVVDEQVT